MPCFNCKFFTDGLERRGRKLGGERGLFSLLKRKKKTASLRVQRSHPEEVFVQRFIEILNDSLQLIETTVYPKTFFGRYKDALLNAEAIVEATQIDSRRAYAQEIIADLTQNRSIKIKTFVDRCSTRGKLYAVKDELLSGKYDIPTDLISYINGLIQEIEEEVKEVPQSGEYIYCSLSFDDAGKTYYYKTNDESLQCGDEVIVPVGKQGRKEIAKIEKIERFAVGETPYPPSLTKDIIEKHTN